MVDVTTFIKNSLTFFSCLILFISLSSVWQKNQSLKIMIDKTYADSEKNNLELCQEMFVQH